MSRWSAPHPGLPGYIRNRHERVVHSDFSTSSEMISALGSPNDPVWPVQWWQPMRLDSGHEIGSKGGHGSVLYSVVAEDPGRSITFEFPDGFVFAGSHRMWIEPVENGVRWVHDLDIIQPRGVLTQILVVFHDACLEDSMDRVKATFEGNVSHAPLSRRIVRLIARLIEGAPQKPHQ